MADNGPGLVDRLKARWRTLQAEHSSVAVAVKSWTRLQDTNGNLYAGAITYFSFLALFPLILLAVSIVGFVLSSQPDTLQTLFDKITTKVPGTVGDTLQTSIQTAIDKRGAVGLVGLVGVLFTGLGWIGNLRRAIDAVWGRPPAQRSFLKEKTGNALILGGLGVGLLTSVGLTALVTALTDQFLELLHLDGVPGMGTLVGILGIALTILADAVVFYWLLVRLPAAEVHRRSGLRGAFLGAVGFEVLKIVGTYTIASTTSSPTAGPFAGILAVLVWIQLVVRYFLYVVAVTAVLTERELAAEVATAAAADPSAGPERGVDAAEPVSTLSPAAVGATLVGAGAVAGAAAVAYVTRRSAHSRSDDG